jgi:hypothetical protein
MTDETRIPERNISRWIAWVLLVCAVAWYGYAMLYRPLASPPYQGAMHGNDFKHIYIGSWMLAEGMNPYDAEKIRTLSAMRGFYSVNPYVYLPFTGLTMSPLICLDPPDALRAWFVANHLFVWGAVVLVFLSLGMRANSTNCAMMALTLAMSFPLFRTLTAGQLNCALLLLFSGVFAFERRGWAVAAGALAGFAFLYKLSPGILLIYFIWNGIAEWRSREAGDRWRPFPSGFRAALAMSVATALLLAGSIAWVGLDTHLAFRGTLRDMSYGHSTWSNFGMHFYRDLANQSFNSLFHHLFATTDETRAWIELGPVWADRATRFATLVCVLGVFWVTRPKQSGFRDMDMRFALFVLLALLIPSLYWDHYAIIAFWPLWACWNRLPERSRVAALLTMAGMTLALANVLEWPGFATIGLIALSAILGGVLGFRYSPVRAPLWSLAATLLLCRFMYNYPAFLSGIGLLAASIRLWGTLILFGLCLSWMKKEK